MNKYRTNSDGSKEKMGMQRFVTYIYAYEDGQKTQNTGYAKIEIRGKHGRMEIHFNNNGMSNGEVRIGFLHVGDKKIEELFLGTLRLENGRGISQFSFLAENVQDTGVSFEKVIGIKMVDVDHQIYQSFWKDVVVPENAEKKEMIEEAEQEVLHTMEIPVRNVFPDDTMESIWRNFEKKRNCVQINEEICAVQIELNDLRELPQKYWYLGNNSFLLHGFFNYHYLLWGKLPDGKWFLGIPGIYERQERVMASVFGFPGFVQTAESAHQEGGLPKQNVYKEHQQGIWYHILED